MDNKILIVAKREYLERVRTRAFLLATLLVPVLMAASFLVPIYVAARSGTSAASRKVRILDATGAGLGDRIATSFRTDKSRPDSVTGPFVVAVPKDQLADADNGAQQPNRQPGPPNEPNKEPMKQDGPPKEGPKDNGAKRPDGPPSEPKSPQDGPKTEGAEQAQDQLAQNEGTLDEGKRLEELRKLLGA